ncbi:MAG: Rho termination factor N-terminal domain-containing protein, partial [Spirochaetaceae bacterium]|nr:Rho termination factor N-terminal domain-containing protein [Spirochaetaceae bacterium]
MSDSDNLFDSKQGEQNNGSAAEGFEDENYSSGGPDAAGNGDGMSERRVIKVRRGRSLKTAPSAQNNDEAASIPEQSAYTGSAADAYESGAAARDGAYNSGGGAYGGNSYGGGNARGYGRNAEERGGGYASYSGGYSRGNEGGASGGGGGSYNNSGDGQPTYNGGGNYNESRAPRQQRARASNYGDNSRQSGGQHYGGRQQGGGQSHGRDSERNERGGSGGSYGSGVYSFNAGGVSAAAINGVVANTLENSPVNFIPPPERFPRMPDVYGKPDPLPDESGVPRLMINELSRLNMIDLRELASNYGISNEDLVSLKKQEIIFALLKIHTERGGVIYAYGSLEILSDGYGFLRSPQNSYLPSSDDIYISQSQIRLFALKTGDTVYGQIRSPKDTERFFAML